MAGDGLVERGRQAIERLRDVVDGPWPAANPRMRRPTRLLSWVFLAVGTCYVVACAWTTASRIIFLQAAVPAPGTVVTLGWHRAYRFPVVAYTAQDGATRTMRGPDEWRQFGFDPGERVTVLHVAPDRHSEVGPFIDTFWQVWQVPLTLAGVALGWLAGAWFLGRRPRPPLWRGHG